MAKAIQYTLSVTIIVPLNDEELPTEKETRDDGDFLVKDVLRALQRDVSGDVDGEVMETAVLDDGKGDGAAGGMMARGMWTRYLQQQQKLEMYNRHKEWEKRK